MAQGARQMKPPNTPALQTLSSQDPRAGIRAETEAPFLPLGEGCHGGGGRGAEAEAEAGVLSV